MKQRFRRDGQLLFHVTKPKALREDHGIAAHNRDRRPRKAIRHHPAFDKFRDLLRKIPLVLGYFLSIRATCPLWNKANAFIRARNVIGHCIRFRSAAPDEEDEKQNE